jgi:hypothetical protein
MVTAEDLGPLLEGVALPASLEVQVHAAAEALTAGCADDALRALEGAPTDVAAVPWLQGAAHLVRADFSRAAPLLERARLLRVVDEFGEDRLCDTDVAVQRTPEETRQHRRRGRPQLLLRPPHVLQGLRQKPRHARGCHIYASEDCEYFRTIEL